MERQSLSCHLALSERRCVKLRAPKKQERALLLLLLLA